MIKTTDINLEKLVIELAMMEAEKKAGNLQTAFRHKVMTVLTRALWKRHLE
ncbi:MAG: hypothetical protein QXX64_02205 [Nitrososphaera sp.]|uniref:hypothetical protein n=1 Tax=Candidatus Nitrososphaera gargensis TaxID=497727 RepID=UPI00164FC181|nr:hypothetical protein [Candidatus Nitrososphaera gargensis]